MFSGRSPVKQSSLFNYFQPSPKKAHNTAENNASSSTTAGNQQPQVDIDNEAFYKKEDWGEEEEEEDVNLLQFLEEVSADTPWPPPCKKSKM